jgi:hypothetical protein
VVVGSRFHDKLLGLAAQKVLCYPYLAHVAPNISVCVQPYMSGSCKGVISHPALPPYTTCLHYRTLHTAVDAISEKVIFQLWLTSGLPQPRQTAAPVTIPGSPRSNSQPGKPKKKRK